MELEHEIAGNEVLVGEISQDSEVSSHGLSYESHGNNNESLPSLEPFKPGTESSIPVKVEALDSNKTKEVFQQDQACASVSKKTEELETGIISNPLDHSNDKGEDESKCQDTLREGSSKVKDLDESKNFSSVEKPFSGTEEAKRADVTAEAVGIVNVVSCHGNEIITSHNDNLVTVIQGIFFLI